MSIRRWDLVELDLSGTSATTVVFTAEGADGAPTVRRVVDVFRAGGAGKTDRLLARFAPDREGTWTYAVADADDQVIDKGDLICAQAASGDHGPVEVSGTRFQHADETPHLPLPTTALWWHHRSESERQATLTAVRDSPITAVRMSILPPEPADWPGPDDLARVESAVIALRDLGRQAELVLFGDGAALARPGWQAYLRDVVARFTAYRNVAWCLAVDADRSGIEPVVWDEALRLVAEHDHARRLCTIGAGQGFDFGDPRISHCSVRTDHARSSSTLNDDFAKPAVLNGLAMEGDAPVIITAPAADGSGRSTGSGRGVGPRPEPVGWPDLVGSLTPEEVVLQAWETAVRGGFPAYGEAFQREQADRRPWPEHGGELHGDALPRLAFLRSVLADIPEPPRYLRLRPDASTLGVPDRYYLQYLGAHRFRSRSFDLPDGAYLVELINTWEQTIEEVLRTDSGRFTVELPPKLYHAIRVRRC